MNDKYLLFLVNPYAITKSESRNPEVGRHVRDPHILGQLETVAEWTKPSLSEYAQVDLTMANLSILKNGRARAIRFSTLDALCRALACQPGDLLAWADTPAHPEQGEER